MDGYLDMYVKCRMRCPFLVRDNSVSLALTLTALYTLPIYKGQTNPLCFDQQFRPTPTDTYQHLPYLPKLMLLSNPYITTHTPHKSSPTFSSGPQPTPAAQPSTAPAATAAPAALRPGTSPRTPPPRPCAPMALRSRGDVGTALCGRQCVL